MNALEVSNLVKSYKYDGKYVTAVDNISFNIKKGEIFALLGPNGAGKSTTINILSGVLTKDSGNITILGKDPIKDHEFVRNQMNVSSAYFGLSDILTLRQNLRVYAKLFNVRDTETKITEMLKLFELYDLRDKNAGSLSSGERTRLSLCKGFINDPKLLLLDECTVGLDPDIAEKTRSIIKDYNRLHKASILFTSHYMFEVEELCKRIAFLSNGKIIRVDNASALKKLIKKHTVEISFIKTNKSLFNFFKDRDIDVEFMGGNTIVFEITSKEDKLYRIMNSLFKRGFKIKDLHIKRPTLDDIFIKIARKEL